MSDTNTSVQLIYERILRDLREDHAIRTRLHGRVYDANKKNVLPTEMPAAVVNVESIAEEHVGDWPILVRVVAVYSIVVFMEEWDPTRTDFGGGREGRGLVQYAQDVKQAFAADQTLGGLVHFFTFPATTLFDSPQYPARAVRVDLRATFLEAQRDRESAAT